eukprot:jgi/Botrbrau1/8281/Bobra.0251s0010.1
MREVAPILHVNENDHLQSLAPSFRIPACRIYSLETGGGGAGGGEPRHTRRQSYLIMIAIGDNIDDALSLIL